MNSLRQTNVTNSEWARSNRDETASGPSGDCLSPTRDMRSKLLFVPLMIGLIALDSPLHAIPTNHEETAHAKTNIVLILADDLGWSGLGCYGSTYYETPRLDDLARQGLRFESAFSAASNCAPSRASIMSGQYTPRHGVLYVGIGDYQDRWLERQGDLKAFRMLQPHGQKTLASTTQTLGETLQSAGYRTGMFGKWHLGTGDQHPSKRGFDVAVESHGAHFGFKTDPEMKHDADQYLTEFLSDQAVSFIEDAASIDQPFFLYYADFLVHKPLEVRERDLAHFSAKAKSQNQKSPIAGSMIKALDDSVGKILDCLDRLNLADDTLVLFTSDNGGLSYEEDGHREENTSNLPLRGRKGSEFDGGLRVPWIVRWPGHVPSGQTCTTPVHHIDLFPTLVTLAGATLPQQVLDGENLLPIFRQPRTQPSSRELYWYLPGYSAFHRPSVMVRQGEWKLIRSLESGAIELYNTADDIGEAIDLVSSQPAKARELDQAAVQWMNNINAPRMIPNPTYEPLQTQDK